MMASGSPALARDEPSQPQQATARSDIQQAQAIIAQSPASQPPSDGMLSPVPLANREKAPQATPPVRPEDRIQSLAREASGQCQKTATYIARLRRREQVGGRQKPEEVLLFKFRREPFSVYFKWLGEEGKGREVVYVRDRYEDKIHTLLAAGDVPLMPAGRKLALSPDNPLVQAASRHPITHAGICYLVGKYAQLAAANLSRPGLLRYIGPISRPELPQPVEAVEQQILSGEEPLLPHGGKRVWMFDESNHLPVLVSTQDAEGHEVEYYCYDRIQFGVPLDDADFNPDILWPDAGSSKRAPRLSN
jgi:Protein of unknown function (DUF1571)